MTTTTHTHPTTGAPAHPRQLRFPGQAAAHEGPVDMAMMYLMHHAFRRDLDAFTAAVPLTPVDDHDAWRAMAERWGLFSKVLHHHHHGEDSWLWPFLMDRVSGDDRATLEAMEAEHAVIDPGLEACASGFTAMVEHPEPDTRAALAVRLTAVREALGRHLHHEETDTIALIQSVMTHEDWEAIDKRFQAALSFGMLVKAVPWALHRVPEDLLEQLFGRTGLLHKVLWRLARPGFERLDRRAFRHLA